MMKNNYNNIRKYALRKLAIGVASCAIGCATLHAVTTTVVHGDTASEMVAGNKVYDISDLIAKLPPSDLKAERYFEKVDMSKIDDVQKALVKEADKININKMLDTSSVAVNVPVSDLKETLLKELGNSYKDYSLVMLDKNHSRYLGGSNTLYLVKNDAEIINTEADYHQFIAKLLSNKDIQPHEIHSSFNFDKLPINILLDANGFGLAGYRHFEKYNEIDLHSGTLRLATSGETVNETETNRLNRKLEEYTEHDQKILDLIEKSKALEETSEARRVEVWARFIRSNFKYDDNAFNKMGAFYNEASSIFSAIERKEAMCVGFSTLSARAYNMMGIKAYVVHGKMKGGAAHAVTRVYYGGRWHFVDTTAAIGHSTSFLLDEYSATENYSLAGEMVTYPTFEKWMEKQRTRDLLLIHRDATKIDSNSSVDRYATLEEKKELLARMDRLEKYCRYLIEKLEKSNTPLNKTNGITSCEGTIKDLNQYRTQINLDEVVVKSYIETFEAKLRGLEGTASSLEFEYFRSNNPEFLTRTITTSNSTTSPQMQTTQPQTQSDTLDTLHSEHKKLRSQYDTMPDGPGKDQLAKKISEFGRLIEEKGGKISKSYKGAVEPEKEEEQVQEKARLKAADEKESLRTREESLRKVREEEEAKYKAEMEKKRLEAERQKALEEQRQLEAQRKAEADEKEALRKQEDTLRKIREQEEAERKAELEKQRLEAEQQQKALDEEHRQLEKQWEEERHQVEQQIQDDFIRLYKKLHSEEALEQERQTENEVTEQDLGQYRIDKAVKLQADAGALHDAINYYNLTKEVKEQLQVELVEAIKNTAQQIREASSVEEVNRLVSTGKEQLEITLKKINSK